MSIFVGDKGTIFELEFRDFEEVDGKENDVGPLPIPDVQEIIFYFKKPNNSVVVKKKSLGEVVLSTDGLDGKARYVGEAGFVDSAGTWERYGWVQLASGEEYSSKIVSFTVNNRFT